MINNNTRIVKATHGRYASMEYKFCCRIESKMRGFFKKRIMYRAVIEKYFMAWEDFAWSTWRDTREDAFKWGETYLDKIESKPDGEYISSNS